MDKEEIRKRRDGEIGEKRKRRRKRQRRIREEGGGWGEQRS